MASLLSSSRATISAMLASRAQASASKTRGTRSMMQLVRGHAVQAASPSTRGPRAGFAPSVRTGLSVQTRGFRHTHPPVGAGLTARKASEAGVLPPRRHPQRSEARAVLRDQGTPHVGADEGEARHQGVLREARVCQGVLNHQGLGVLRQQSPAGDGQCVQSAAQPLGLVMDGGNKVASAAEAWCW